MFALDSAVCSLACSVVTYTTIFVWLPLLSSLPQVRKTRLGVDQEEEMSMYMRWYELNHSPTHPPTHPLYPTQAWRGMWADFMMLYTDPAFAHPIEALFAYPGTCTCVVEWSGWVGG